VYRDYMNRQRYFSDDLGWNVSVRLNFEFWFRTETNV
jgi:hypothetical protein